MLTIPGCSLCRNPAEFFSEVDFRNRACLDHKDIMKNRYKSECLIPVSDYFNDLLEAKNLSEQVRVDIYSNILKTSARLIKIIKEEAKGQLIKIDKIIKEVDGRIKDFYIPSLIKNYLQALNFFFSSDAYFEGLKNEISPFFKIEIPKFLEEDKDEAPQNNLKGLKFVRFMKFKPFMQKNFPKNQDALPCPEKQSSINIHMKSSSQCYDPIDMQNFEEDLTNRDINSKNIPEQKFQPEIDTPGSPNKKYFFVNRVDKDLKEEQKDEGKKKVENSNRHRQRNCSVIEKAEKKNEKPILNYNKPYRFEKKK